MCVMIIAEAGVNHNGKLKTALRLVDAASKIGADMVKFQTFTAKNLVSPSTQKANYQKKIFYSMFFRNQKDQMLLAITGAMHMMRI